MVKMPGKYSIRVYDIDGNVVETITRIIYRFNRGRTQHYGQYYGVNYKNCRPKVYGDCEHPNGLYIFQGDFTSKPNEEVRAKIHAQHVFRDGDIMNIGQPY